MKKEISILILLCISAMATILTADTIANITAHNDRSLTIDKGSSDGVQSGMRGKIQVVGKDAVGQYEVAIGEFVVKKVYTNSAEIYAERVESGKNLDSATFVVFESTLKAPSSDSTANSSGEIGTKPSSGTTVKDEAARIQEIISLIQSSAQKKQWKNWQASLADYSNAINLYDSLGKEVKAAVEQSDARVIGTIYSQRGFCKFQLKDIEGAVADWKIAEKYGCRDDEVIMLTKNEYFRLEAEFQDEMNRRAEMERARLAALAEADLWEEEEEEEESEVPSLSETLAKGLQGIADSFRQNQEVIQEIKRRREEQKEQLLEQENQRRQANLQILRDDQEQIRKRKEEQERQRAEEEQQRKEQEEAQKRMREKLEQEAKNDELNAEWSPPGPHQAGRRGTVNLITPRGYYIAIMSWRVVEEKQTSNGIAMIAEYFINNKAKYVTLYGCLGSWKYNGEVVGITQDNLYQADVHPDDSYQGRVRIDLPKNGDPSSMIFKWSTAKR